MIDHTPAIINVLADVVFMMIALTAIPELHKINIFRSDLDGIIDEYLKDEYV